jgi:hypothetical protein
MSALPMAEPNITSMLKIDPKYSGNPFPFEPALYNGVIEPNARLTVVEWKAIQAKLSVVAVAAPKAFGLVALFA